MDEELVANLWYIHDENGYIFALRARAYLAAGSDEEKLAFLRAFATVDYAIARPFALPEKFYTRVIHPEGERIVPAVHVTYLHHRGGEAALFDEAMEALQAELPANSGLQFGASPLVCITPLEWDGAERVWPSATKRTDL